MLTMASLLLLETIIGVVRLRLKANIKFMMAESQLKSIKRI